MLNSIRIEATNVGNVISAQELKRRGIGAVDRALREGPVHVIRRNRPSYVILSEEQYRQLLDHGAATERLWDRLQNAAPSGNKRVAEIDAALGAERGSWDD